MPQAKEIFEFIAEHDQSALSLLQTSQFSTATIKQAAQQGSIWWQSGNSKPKRIRRLKKVIQTTDKIWFYYDPDIMKQQVNNAELVLDKNAFSIWLKPRGMFSQPSRWSDENSIARNVEVQLNRPTYLVHRLDRMTAGLIIVAHQRGLVEAFTEYFRQGKISKKYRAVINGQLKEQSIEITSPIDDKPTKTRVSEIHFDPDKNLSLVEVEIYSGKKHQIRRHLSELGKPIVGDRLYGEVSHDQQSPHEDLQLVATNLVFSSPTDDGLISVALYHEQIQQYLML